MADLVAFHQYYSHRDALSPSTMTHRANGHGHKRSLSSEPRSRSAQKTVTKTKSANDLTRFIANKALPNHPSASSEALAENNFNTIKDPRLANSPGNSEASSSPSHHPDLNNEVAALSVKLVQALNNQTTLDDDLAAARQELESAQTRIQALELENEKFRRDIDEEVLVRKANVDYEMLRVKAALADERAQRAMIEKDKKAIEQELETLTAALFEEANKMVAAAKLEREAVEKKNEQLRCQVKDTELLLASHQDQLAELKAVLQGLSPGKDDTDVHTSASTAPSSPVASQRPISNIKKTVDVADVLEETPSYEEPLPGPSTSFPQFIKSVCRTDVPAYEDFRELFSLAASSKPPSRAASGSYSGLNAMSLASLASHTGGRFGSSISSPTKSQTHSPNGSLSSPHATSPHFPLKETRFYKRVVTEDIEPTLRLDAAPGISWLTRRSVMSGICEGSLIVEPMPASAKKFVFECSVCGEHRPGTANERTHRFRTSDNETAQRYPLCVVCLERVRSSCEFTGYLRLILDGHVRVNDSEEEKEAWEETIRLRERMFWARIAGGVVPLLSPPNDVDASLREATSASSIYSKEHPARRSLLAENMRPQPRAGDGNDDAEGSITDENYLSAGSQSSASSITDAPHASEGREAEGFDSAKHEESLQMAGQSTSSVTADQNGAHASETYASENHDRQSFGSARHEMSEHIDDQPTSSVAVDHSGAYPSEDRLRQVRESLVPIEKRVSTLNRSLGNQEALELLPRLKMMRKNREESELSEQVIGQSTSVEASPAPQDDGQHSAKTEKS